MEYIVIKKGIFASLQNTSLDNFEQLKATQTVIVKCVDYRQLGFNILIYITHVVQISSRLVVNKVL